KEGQTVKRGDTLVDLMSEALAAAKNEFQTTSLQWESDKKLLELRERLSKQNAITEQMVLDTRNNESRSKLAFQLARGKLKILGLEDRDIERIGHEDNPLRLSLRCPVDGTVVRVVAEPGNLYDKNDVLIHINATSSETTVPER